MCSEKRHSVSLSEDAITAARGMYERQRGSFRRRLRTCAGASLIGHHGAHVENNWEPNVEDGEQSRQS